MSYNIPDSDEEEENESPPPPPPPKKKVKKEEGGPNRPGKVSFLSLGLMLRASEISSPALGFSCRHEDVKLILLRFLGNKAKFEYRTGCSTTTCRK